MLYKNSYSSISQLPTYKRVCSFFSSRKIIGSIKCSTCQYLMFVQHVQYATKCCSQLLLIDTSINWQQTHLLILHRNFCQTRHSVSHCATLSYLQTYSLYHTVYLLVGKRRNCLPTNSSNELAQMAILISKCTARLLNSKQIS